MFQPTLVDTFAVSDAPPSVDEHSSAAVGASLLDPSSLSADNSRSDEGGSHGFSTSFDHPKESVIDRATDLGDAELTNSASTIAILIWNTDKPCADTNISLSWQ
jgi:hypothetical protein